MPYADDRIYRKFAELLARIMPFDLAIDEQTADGEEARVSKTSVCGSWGAVAGNIRYFADRFGIPRAAIEGTQIPFDLIRRNVTHGKPAVVYDPQRKRAPLALSRKREYFGFELGRELEPIDEFPPEFAEAARYTLAEALARYEARHLAVKRNRAAIEELREVYRRSGGLTPRLGLHELIELYERMLRDVSSIDEFRAKQLVIDPDAIVPREDRARWLALPDTTLVRGREIPIDYDVEDGAGGVARLRLPEKLARTLVEEELPALDRPLRFVVPRGQRGAVRAATLGELQELLDRPWMADEVELEWERGEPRRGRGGRGHRGSGGRRDQRGATGGRQPRERRHGSGGATADPRRGGRRRGKR
jgi:hypothetical protein